jgi:glucokinase
MGQVSDGVATLGLDIGATKTLGVALTAAGEVAAEVRVPTRPGADGLVATTRHVVDRLQETVGLPGTLGIGIPGLVDTGQGTLQHAVNLGVDGDPVPLRALLVDALGIPVQVENDVNAAALGAAALTGSDDVVYLSLGTGLAAGAVLDGRLRRGVRGAAGEVGHVSIDPAGAVCGCGQRGCLETIASGRALQQAWPAHEHGDVPPAQAVWAAAGAGDARAVEVRDRFVDGVAHALRLLALTLDPEVLMIGGGVAQLGEPLRAAVAAALARQASASAFLSSLDLPARVRVVPENCPVAAVGAALLGTGWPTGGAR